MLNDIKALKSFGLGDGILLMNYRFLLLFYFFNLSAAEEARRHVIINQTPCWVWIGGRCIEPGKSGNIIYKEFNILEYKYFVNGGCHIYLKTLKLPLDDSVIKYGLGLKKELKEGRNPDFEIIKAVKRYTGR